MVVSGLLANSQFIFEPLPQSFGHERFHWVFAYLHKHGAVSRPRLAYLDKHGAVSRPRLGYLHKHGAVSRPRLAYLDKHGAVSRPRLGYLDKHGAVSRPRLAYLDKHGAVSRPRLGYLDKHGAVSRPRLAYLDKHGAVSRPRLGYLDKHGAVSRPRLAYLDKHGAVSRPRLGYLDKHGAVSRPRLAYLHKHGAVSRPRLGYLHKHGAVSRPRLGYLALPLEIPCFPGDSWTNFHQILADEELGAFSLHTFRITSTFVLGVVKRTMISRGISFSGFFRPIWGDRTISWFDSCTSSLRTAMSLTRPSVSSGMPRIRTVFFHREYCSRSSVFSSKAVTLTFRSRISASFFAMMSPKDFVSPREHLSQWLIRRLAVNVQWVIAASRASIAMADQFSLGAAVTFSAGVSVRESHW